jgi:hypothetical protein
MKQTLKQNRGSEIVNTITSSLQSERRDFLIRQREEVQDMTSKIVRELTNEIDLLENAVNRSVTGRHAQSHTAPAHEERPKKRPYTFRNRKRRQRQHQKVEATAGTKKRSHAKKANGGKRFTYGGVDVTPKVSRDGRRKFFTVEQKRAIGQSAYDFMKMRPKGTKFSQSQLAKRLYGTLMKDMVEPFNEGRPADQQIVRSGKGPHSRYSLPE